MTTADQLNLGAQEMFENVKRRALSYALEQKVKSYLPYLAVGGLIITTYIILKK